MDSLPNIAKFVERNLGGGADHLIIFYEGADEEVLGFLRPHPDVTLVHTDADYWKGRRPDSLNDRQVLNANTANVLLAPFPWAAWLFHIDGDEVLALDPASLRAVPDDIPAIRLRTLEAISQTHWETDVTHFKRPLGRNQLALLVALGVISAPNNRAYFRGHVIGKPGIRANLDSNLQIHSARSSSEAELPTFRGDGLDVLHYESFSGDEFVRKWTTHIVGEQRPARRPARRYPIRRALTAVLRLPDLTDQQREKYIMRIYDSCVRDDMATLLELGLLVERPPREHRPRPLSREQRDLYEQWLAALMRADRRYFHPDITDWPVTNLVGHLSVQLRAQSRELAELTGACVETRPRLRRSRRRRRQADAPAR
jgi:hypothetical protein